MYGAERHREFIADFQTQPTRLSVAYVMGMRWRPSADSAGLTGDVAEMLLAANSPRLANCQHALVNLCCRAMLMGCGVELVALARATAHCLR